MVFSRFGHSHGRSKKTKKNTGFVIQCAALKSPNANFKDYSEDEISLTYLFHFTYGLPTFVFSTIALASFFSQLTMLGTNLYCPLYQRPAS